MSDDDYWFNQRVDDAMFETRLQAAKSTCTLSSRNGTTPNPKTGTAPRCMSSSA